MMSWLRARRGVKLQIDPERPYAIALEGGGAKGAYQIGAWRALKEAGVQICAVAGTSVGALNGAFICMDMLEEAEQLWDHISMSSVIAREDMFRRGGSEYMNWFRALKEGGFDISPLRQLIEDHISEQRVKESAVKFYIMTYSVTERRELVVDAQTLASGSLNEMILASASLPFFKVQKIDGIRYMDGGMFDNVAVEPLIQRGYQNIIALRIYGVGHDKRSEIPEGCCVHAIAPRHALGKILQFEEKRCRRERRLGYYDGMRMLYGLRGRRYYIDDAVSEAEYFRRLTDLDSGVMSGVLEKMGLLPKDSDKNLRVYVERALPRIAKELDLADSCTYQELYVAMLELTAHIYKIEVLGIYTVGQLLEQIRQRQCQMKKRDEAVLPVCVNIICNQKDV